MIHECPLTTNETYLIELDAPITTIPGIGPILDASILTEIGDIRGLRNKETPGYDVYGVQMLARVGSKNKPRRLQNAFYSK